MLCKKCKNEINDNSLFCEHCGNKLKKVGSDSASEKDFLTTLIFCCFLGIFGTHRFYLGRTKTGITMLILTLIPAISGLEDIFFINSDLTYDPVFYFINHILLLPIIPNILWTLIDLFLITTRLLTDSNNQKLTYNYTMGFQFFMLIVFPIIITILLIFSNLYFYGSNDSFDTILGDLIFAIFSVIVILLLFYLLIISFIIIVKNSIYLRISKLSNVSEKIKE